MGNTIFIKDRRVCFKPLQSRLEAIEKLKPPTTVKGCRSFEGMINFLSLFCLELEKLLKPIYDLARKGRKSIWGKEHYLAFNEIKSRIVKLPVLHQAIKEDFIYTQILVNMPWEVLYIKFRMTNQS